MIQYHDPFQELETNRIFPERIEKEIEMVLSSGGFRSQELQLHDLVHAIDEVVASNTTHIRDCS